MERVLYENIGAFESEDVENPLGSDTLIRYRSAIVDLWVENGVIVQIMVHGRFHGLIQGRIGLGSTLAEIEDNFGSCEEDEEDNLVINGLPGLCFEIDGSFADLKNRSARHAVIKEIYVFHPSKERNI